MNTRFRLPRLMAPDGGDGGAGGAGGGAGTPPAPPPAGGAGGTPTQPPAPPGLAWLPGADETTVGYAQNKGWGSANDAVTGYRNLEQVLGADRAGRTIVLPKDDQDVTTRQAMWTKLGWSADAGAYHLPVPEGADPQFAKDMAGLFSKHGIPVAQAKALVADWNAYVGENAKKAAGQDAAALQADTDALARDWGAQMGARTEVAKRGFRALAEKAGVDQAGVESAIAAIEKGVGMRGAMKMMALVGDMLREHGALGAEAPGSFGMTPEGAKAERQQLIADKEFVKKAMVPNSAEWARIKRLDEIIAGAAA